MSDLNSLDEVSEESEVSDKVPVHIQPTFIQKILEVRGIPLYDFYRIHDEALTYMKSLKVDYVYCSAKLHPVYRQIYLVGSNSDTYFSRSNMNYFFYLLWESKKELESILSMDSTILKSYLSSVKDQKSNALLYHEYIRYINSPYRHLNIEVTIEDWCKEKLSEVNADIEIFVSLDGLTNEELIQRFSFTPDDYTFVYKKFEEVKDWDLHQALVQVTQGLTNTQQRAYLEYLLVIFDTWIDGLSLNHWFKVVDRAYSH